MKTRNRLLVTAAAAGTIGTGIIVATVDLPWNPMQSWTRM